MYYKVVSRNLAPEADRDNWGARLGLRLFNSRLKLVTRQLERAPYMAGESFTAADIAVTYSLEFAQRSGGYVLGAPEQAYVERTTSRAAYQRAMAVCHDTRQWAAEAAASNAAGVEKS